MKGDRDRMLDDPAALKQHREDVKSDYARRTAKKLDEVADAEIKKLRMRRWPWRREWLSGPYMHADHKALRVAARRSGAPLHLVEAFVRRLDDYVASNSPRGSLTGFSFSELAAHWGLPADDILARIYAALETPEIGWIDGDFIVDFWARNPDTPDNTSAERQEKSRAFRDALRRIEEHKRLGRIDDATRDRMEVALHALRERSRGGGVPDWRQQLKTLTTLSTEPLSQRDSVTVTPRAEQILNRSSVENSDAAASGESQQSGEGQAESSTIIHSIGAQGGAQAVEAIAEPEEWLANEGLRLVIERLAIVPGAAATKMQRWLREVDQDHAALAGIITAAQQRAPERPAHFVALIGDGINRFRDEKAGARLPLAAPLQGGVADNPQSVPSQRDGGIVDKDLAAAVARLRKAVGDE